MVDFGQVMNAKPELWKAAAEGWESLAKQAEDAADDIYGQGAAKVTESWDDNIGANAVDKLKLLAESYVAGAAAIRGVVSTLHGLDTAVGAVQRSLRSAVEFAASAGFVVDAAGRVTPGPGVPRPGDELRIQQLNAQINEAIESATRIDQEASAELDKLATAVTNTDVTKARDGFLQSASENQLDLLRESLPIGKDPATVAAWWTALTPEQQAAYARAVPVDLHDLQGIPEEVKQQLRAGDGYDPVAAVRWAQDNWNNGAIDAFGNNCANFVSHALLNGGLDQKLDPGQIPPGPLIPGAAPAPGSHVLNPDSWGYVPTTGVDAFDARNGSYSESWRLVQKQQDFLMSNGGQEVPAAQARPGDVIYFSEAATGGVPYHAAVVTSVTPDGDVHYTQHTHDLRNASLNGRLPYAAIDGGDQEVTIVRPKQTW